MQASLSADYPPRVVTVMLLANV
ncbi:MAG: hypothetical protein FD126_1387, partial [Elusimicrobia bacterium]